MTQREKKKYKEANKKAQKVELSGSAEGSSSTANSIHPCSACNGEVDNGL